MKYILICRDGKDADAMNRRLSAREKHLKDIQKNENFVFGTAILEEEKMVGSVMVMDFENKNQVQDYLKNDAYTQGDVWKNVEIIPCANGFFGERFGN